MGQRHRRRANINPALVEGIVTLRKHAGTFCTVYVLAYIDPAGTKRSPGVDTVLVHSPRRWIGVVPALGGRISHFVLMTMRAIAQ